jgi:hypothetical protein
MSDKSAALVALVTYIAGAAIGRPTSGHFYVDMSKPTETLVVSRDEYVDVVYPWQSPA